MSDDCARHCIGGNFPPEAIDDSAQYDSSPPEPISTRRRDSPPEPLGDIPSPLLSVPATQRYLGGLSLTVLYDKMRLGELEVCKLGGRRFITLRSCNDLIERNCSRSLGDALAIERAKKAARESVRVRKEKKRLVPGKLRTRAARHAARASNEGGADTQGNAIPAQGTSKLKPASRQRRKSERRSADRAAGGTPS